MRRVIHVAASRGVDPVALCRIVSLTFRELGDPEEWVPVTAMYEVWEACARELDDPALPIDVAEALQLEDYHAIGYALMLSRDGFDAIHRVVRFGSLITDSGCWELRDNGDEVSVIWHRGGPLTLGHRLANECAIASFAGALRHAVPDDGLLRDVFFRHPAPRCSAAHRRRFGRLPRFAAEEDGFTLAAAPLRAPLHLPVRETLASFLDDLLEARSQDTAAGVVERTSELIARCLASGVPSASELARRLGVSVRGLQRILSDNGTTLRELIDKVRRERAADYLPSRSVTETAFLLGFSETSALTRAFRRWYGVSPRDYQSRVNKLA